MSSDKQLIALKDKKIYDARKELDISKRMRGIDNNNPGNIRVGNNQWLGLVTDPDLFLPNQKGEREFCVFYHPKYGVRAMVILLLNYQRKYRLKTIEQLIQRYAPGNENNTVEYIRSVSADSGIGAKEEIAIADYYTARRIIVAMIKHENGVQPYPDEVIEVGLGMAGLSTPGEIAPNEVKVVKTENVAAGVAAVGTTAAGALEAVKTMYVENQAAISGITSQLSGLSTVSYIQLGLGVAILGALLYLILRRKDASFLRIR